MIRNNDQVKNDKGREQKNRREKKKNKKQKAKRTEKKRKKERESFEKNEILIFHIFLSTMYHTFIGLNTSIYNSRNLIQ